MYFVCANHCDKNIEASLSYPSYRDGVYKGKCLTVKVNGVIFQPSVSVFINSEIIETNYNSENCMIGEINTVYSTKVKIKGFPLETETLVFTTNSDLQGFEGVIHVENSASLLDGQYIKYAGIFTGDPIFTHDEKGLILEFTTPKHS